MARRIRRLGVSAKAQMRWKTYNRLDEKAQAYEKAADDELLWRVRRLLLPGEGIGGLMDRILK